MFLDWSQAARQDILGIVAYFESLGEEETGKNIVSKILSSSDILLSFPLSGRIGRIGNTREMVVRNLPIFSSITIRARESQSFAFSTLQNFFLYGNYRFKQSRNGEQKLVYACLAT